MTENKRIFCEGVARLCDIAGAPELYAPIVKLVSIYEAAAEQQGQTTDANTTIAQVDLNKVPQEELDSLQAEFAQSSEAKKAVDAAGAEKETAEQNLETAQQNQSEINANLANKLNATAADVENNTPDDVNSEENV